MEKVFKKSAVAILIIAIILSSGLSQVFAQPEVPATIQSSESNFGYDFKIVFDDSSSDWINNIEKILVNNEAYEKGTSQFSVFNNKKYYVDSSYKTIYIGEGCTFNNGKAECVVSSTGYEDIIIELDKSTYGAAIKGFANSTEGGSSGSGESGEKPETDKNDAPNTSIIQDNGYIEVSFSDAEYAAGISNVSVGDTALSIQTSKIALNGKQYYLDKNNNKLYLDDWNRAFKSGDTITISNPNYKDIKLKATIVGNTVSFLPADQETDASDPYEIHVRLRGTFEAAVVNQSGYDATTSASTNITQNKNSNVNVEVAITETGISPVDTDWKLLSDTTSSDKIIVDTEKTSLHIVNSLTGEKDSSMDAIYSTYDGSVTLAGTPSKAGLYKIYVELVDEQGRKAISNQLDFRVYTGNEYLEDCLTLENSVQTADGKYMYDMEPWTISSFDNNDNIVTVPKEIKAWYGSHTSGTYGKLGYAISSGSLTTQTLVIPEGCNLTMVNMDALSSVKIIVMDGGMLTLRDSVVNGIIEVEKGGTLSVDYDSYSDQFMSGSSINGQIIMKNGSILENARIKSNTNYIANGDEARQNDSPVVVTEGNVTIKGQVIIKGDEAATYSDGQVGLKVSNGTLNLSEGSYLAVYGGGYLDLTTNGGAAIQLNKGSITGAGKLIAVGGAGMFGSGGNAVEGTGVLSASNIYLEGGASKFAENPAVGKALTESITIASTSNKTLINGQNVTSNAAEIDRGTMWNGVDLTPDLDKYIVELNGTTEENPADESGNGSSSGTNSGNTGALVPAPGQSSTLVPSVNRPVSNFITAPTSLTASSTTVSSLSAEVTTDNTEAADQISDTKTPLSDTTSSEENTNHFNYLWLVAIAILIAIIGSGIYIKKNKA